MLSGQPDMVLWRGNEIRWSEGGRNVLVYNELLDGPVHAREMDVGDLCWLRACENLSVLSMEESFVRTFWYDTRSRLNVETGGALCSEAFRLWNYALRQRRMEALERVEGDDPGRDGCRRILALEGAEREHLVALNVAHAPIVHAVKNVG